MTTDSARDVLTLFEELHTAGRTLVVITHDADVAEVAERTIRIRDGLIVTASEINSLGTNLLTVSPGSSTSSSGIRGGFGSASTLTPADATGLSSKTVAPDIKAVAPVASSSETLTDSANRGTANP